MEDTDLQCYEELDKLPNTTENTMNGEKQQTWPRASLNFLPRPSPSPAKKTKLSSSPPQQQYPDPAAQSKNVQENSPQS